MCGGVHIFSMLKMSSHIHIFNKKKTRFKWKFHNLVPKTSSLFDIKKRRSSGNEVENFTHYRKHHTSKDDLDQSNSPQRTTRDLNDAWNASLGTSLKCLVPTWAVRYLNIDVNVLKHDLFFLWIFTFNSRCCIHKFWYPRQVVYIYIGTHTRSRHVLPPGYY